MANVAKTHTEAERRADPRRFRREIILAAATELFETRGYYGVGINEIGRAAGITGPGLYRHFASKHDILYAIIDRASNDLLSGGTEITAVHGGEEGLWKLSAFHCDWVLNNHSAGAVFFRESKNLEPEARRHLNQRQRLYIGTWISCLEEIRPKLSDRELFIATHGAISVLNSAVFPGIDARAERDILVQMSVGSLLAL